MGLRWVYVLKSGKKSAPVTGTPVVQPIPKVSKDATDAAYVSMGSATVSPHHEVFGKISSSPSRTIGRILKADIKDEVKYWANVKLCYVNSANPPLQVAEGFVRRIRNGQVINKVGMVNRRRLVT